MTKTTEKKVAENKDYREGYLEALADVSKVIHKQGRMICNIIKEGEAKNIDKAAMSELQGMLIVNGCIELDMIPKMIQEARKVQQ